MRKNSIIVLLFSMLVFNSAFAFSAVSAALNLDPMESQTLSGQNVVRDSRAQNAIHDSSKQNVTQEGGKQEAAQDNTVYTVVDDEPEFPGGQRALMEFIATNLHYPKAAADNGVQGRVSVSFVVETDGSISDVQEMRSPSKELTDEAFRIVKSMPKWKPGKQKGQPVRVKYLLPITFRLQ